MAVQSQANQELASAEVDESGPTISVCETCPGTVVFLEAGNTDGWIATDTPIELEQ
ncbi:hypothetical protein [Halobellus sp. GM3]|uniref:hypothetical protein n=1 Tax=Halobellus sp. GM3 TaxID=3458410 RepID=UPI00403E0EA5